MLSSHGRNPCKAFHHFLQRFMQAPGLPLSSGLTEEKIQEACREENVSFGSSKNCIFTPALTLWAFVSQVLHDDKTCDGAVARIRSYLFEKGRVLCKNANSAYCKARQKLPEGLLRRLAVGVAQGVDEQIRDAFRWHAKDVVLVDGFTASMEDTQANRQEYSQSSNQKPGLGFPLIRIVGLFSLATGVLRHAALGPHRGKETGELALLRSLLDQVAAGCILLADRYFCSYFMIVLAVQCGLDVVFRMHASRDYDFRRGKRLGKGDHQVLWNRPAKPKWMTQAVYERMPETLAVREVKIVICSRGQKTEKLVVVTTLLDAKFYSKDDLTDLYRQRWLVELDIRTIKTYLKMEHLRCKSPSMVRKDIWTHFLAYNLVRQAMAQTALLYDISPRRFGFTNAKRQLVEFEAQLTHASGDRQDLLFAEIFHAIASVLVGDRPNRVEPRAVKRRPKPYPRLNKPRSEAKAILGSPLPVH